MEIKNKLQKIRQTFSEKQIDAILVSQLDNLYYLSGCEGLEGYLLINESKSVIATDFRYVEQAQKQSPEYEIFPISGKMTEWLPGFFSGFNIHRLGFESNVLSFASYEQIAAILKDASLQINLVPVNGLIESLRAIKDRREIENISRAAAITDAVLEHISKVIISGMTEKELAWEIEKYMREHGSQTVPFDLIVASGPNAALPHARPSDRIIRSGEPVVIDIGSKYNYYGSDLTRTFCAGKPDATFKKVYNIVLKAQLTAIAEIKPGMSGSQADAIARSVIAKAGYGEAFGHGLGHGIGLVVHENPRLGINSTDILAEGMVFTIEPGIYLSGWGGVRIEDDVVIENGKIRVISTARK